MKQSGKDFFNLLINNKKLINKKQIKNLNLLSKNKKIKEEKNENYLLFLEGNRLIKDAINYQLIPHSIYITTSYLNKYTHNSNNESQSDNSNNCSHSDNNNNDIFTNKLKEFMDILYFIDEINFIKISNVENSQGIIALFNKPSLPSNYTKNNSSSPLILICDRLSDPGNLGSIIRSSFSFGVDLILAVETCDIWVFIFFSSFSLSLSLYFFLLLFFSLQKF